MPKEFESREPRIDLATFKRLDIRVGTITTAAKIEGADTLLRLTVSFGTETRTIVSGIATYYPDPGALVGISAAFAYNLAPRTIRGIESQGMILAALDKSGNFSLLHAQGVGSGAKVQ